MAAETAAGVKAIDARLDVPATVRIGPFDFRIGELPDVAAYKSDSDGTCDVDRLEILLNHSRAPAAILETLMHEIEHAIQYLCDTADDASAEDRARRETPYRMALWRDNPQLRQLVNRYAEKKETATVDDLQG